jgi:dTDP-4-dehydrorhamnose 3,5-epimerase-like enzyme
LPYDERGVLVSGEVELAGVQKISYKPHADPRGYLLRVFDSEMDIVQESISHTDAEGTLRGLHVQMDPVEAKVITVIQGVTQWVVVDIRRERDTFGKWKSFDLRPFETLSVGKGFAHGCLSLTTDCTLLVRASEKFSNTGRGFHWRSLGIEWKRDPRMVSARDESYGSFEEFVGKYGGL